MRQFWHDAQASLFVPVFGLVLLFTLVVHYPFDSFFAVDPYYHLSQARGYAAHTEVTYPQLTFFSKYPSDPWFLYHQLIAASFIGADLSDTATLIARSVLFHSVLSALLIATLVVMSVSYYKTVLPVYTRRLAVWNVPLKTPHLTDTHLTLLFVGVYLFVSMSFVYRVLLLERPHVLMVSLVLLGLWSLIRQRYWLLPVLASVAALSYSMSLFIFIPAGTLLVGWLVIDRSLPGLKQALVPVWYTLGGFIAGVLLHPGVVGYLVNGIVFHLYAITQSLFWWLPHVPSLPTPGEMIYQTEGMIALLVPVVIVLGVFWFLLRYGRARILSIETASQPFMLEAGFTTMAVFFGIATLLIQRAIEYAVPFLGVVCVTVIIGLLWSLVPYLHHHIVATFPDPRSFYQSAVGIVRRLVKKRLTRYIFLGFVLTYTLIFSTFIYQREPVITTTNRLEDIMVALSGEAPVGLVMLSAFSLYPQAIFYGPTYHYASGMDPRMTYFYDAATHRELDVFLGQGIDCDSECHNFDPARTHTFLKQIGATHLITDSQQLLDNQLIYITEQPFLELVYQSEPHPGVRLYRIIEE